MAIVLSVLGLVGLVSFITKTTEREIGIRKVFGARTRQILLLLNREFFILAILASLLASPLSYWAISNWLEVFAYWITPGYFVYITAVVLCVLDEGTAVSLQSYHAAGKNPAESLKNEQ